MRFQDRRALPHYGFFSNIHVRQVAGKSLQGLSLHLMDSEDSELLIWNTLLKNSEAEMPGKIIFFYGENLMAMSS